MSYAKILLVGLAFWSFLAMSASAQAETMKYSEVEFELPDRDRILDDLSLAVGFGPITAAPPDVTTRSYEYWEGVSGKLWYRPASGFCSWRSWNFIDYSGVADKLDPEQAGLVALSFLQSSGVIPIDGSDRLYVSDVSRGIRSAVLLETTATDSHVQHIRVTIGRRINGMDVQGTAPAVVYLGPGYSIVGLDLLWRRVSLVREVILDNDISLDESLEDALARAESDSGLGYEGTIELEPRAVLFNYSWASRQVAAIPYMETWAIFSGVRGKAADRVVWPVHFTWLDPALETEQVETSEPMPQWPSAPDEEGILVVSDCGPNCL